MSEYRPVPRERAEEFFSLMRYAFSPQSGPPDGEDFDVDEGRWEMGDPVGMFDADGTLCSTARHYYWPIRIRGAFHPAAGLSAVATPPEHRHRGLVGEILSASLREYRDRGVVLSALWPFDHRFYGKYGWRVGSALQEVTFEPEALEGAVPERAGTFRRLRLDDVDGDGEDGDDVDDGDDFEREHTDGDDTEDGHDTAAEDDGFEDPAARRVEAEALDAVYRSRVEPYDLVVDRDADWWRYQVLHGWENEPYTYGWFDEGDELRALVVYVFEEPDDVEGRRLRVWEHAATDHEARRQLLRFYHSHASQVTDVRLYDTLDAPWRDLGEDPRAFDVEIKPGVMVRLVDVAAALGAIDYPAGVTADLALEVVDDHADWNDGRFHLAVADGEGAVTSDVDADPAVKIDVGTLTQLIIGYRPADVLAETGMLEAGDESALDTLDACFPPRELSMPTGF